MSGNLSSLRQPGDLVRKNGIASQEWSETVEDRDLECRINKE